MSVVFALGVSQTTGEQEAALERLRTLFRLFAGTQCEGRSALYTRLSHGLVGVEWIAPAQKPTDDFSWGPAEGLFSG